MSNIFDYMDWRDISFNNVEFNEIDNLILARLSYFPFDDIVKNQEITLQEAYSLYQKNGTLGRILQQEDIDFFPKLANSKRFGLVKLTDYINHLDIVQEKQFCAITIVLPDNTIYVSYRGTDNSIVGWKEDFNMSFREKVASQIEAVHYLEMIAQKYSCPIRVGGHSKGGNLAVYASAFCDKSIQNRIIAVYNNDGPGFHEHVIVSRGYQSILPKIHTYIPQSSIIGRLLEHPESITIVKSIQTGIMQHDLYTWQVLGDKFVQASLTNSSDFIDKTVSNWLKEVKPEQREQFIEILFEILNAAQVETFSDMANKKFETAKIMLSTYRNLDDKSKEVLAKTLNAFFRHDKKNK